MDELQLLLKTPVHIFENNSMYNLEYKERTPRIYCMDGTSFSIQTGEYNYCTPRDNIGPWTHVELGFPSKKFDCLTPYQDNSESDQESTVFGFVPIELVRDMIDKCGGICYEWMALNGK